MKTIQITIEKAVVTSVFTSEKNGNQYVTLSSPAGEYKFSCPAGVHDFNPYLEADRQDYTFAVNGRLFNNQQSLTIQRVMAPAKVKPQ